MKLTTSFKQSLCFFCSRRPYKHHNLLTIMLCPNVRKWTWEKNCFSPSCPENVATDIQIF